jgi:peroxiredoxin
MQDLAKDFPDFEFVGIHSNVDEDLETSKTYFEQKKLVFPVIQDRNAQIADQFKAFKTPHAFVLSSEGKILYQGGVTNSAQFSRANKKFLREALEDIRSKKDIRTPEGRTLGCVIARSK